MEPTVVTLTNVDIYTTAAPGVLIDTITATGAAQWWKYRYIWLSGLTNTDASITLTLTYQPSGGSELPVDYQSLYKVPITATVLQRKLFLDMDSATDGVLRLYAKSTNATDTAVSGTLARTLVPVDAASTIGTAVWAVATSGLTTAGSIGKKLADWTILTSQAIRDALKLAPSAGDAAAGSIDTAVADIAEALSIVNPAAPTIGGAMALTVVAVDGISADYARRTGDYSTLAAGSAMTLTSAYDAAKTAASATALSNAAALLATKAQQDTDSAKIVTIETATTGLTATRNAKLDNLDAAVTTRSTLAVGSEMTLSSGALTALQAALIDETDGQAVMAAIIAKINAAYPDLDGLVAATIVTGVFDALKDKVTLDPEQVLAIRNNLASEATAQAAVDAVTNLVIPDPNLTPITEALAEQSLTLDGIAEVVTTNLDVPVSTRSTLGTGPIHHPYVITENIAPFRPIQNVEVWCYSDVALTNLCGHGHTDLLGTIIFNLDAGTYYFVSRKTGVDFNNPDTEEVTEPE